MLSEPERLPYFCSIKSWWRLPEMKVSVLFYFEPDFIFEQILVCLWWRKKKEKKRKARICNQTPSGPPVSVWPFILQFASHCVFSISFECITNYPELGFDCRVQYPLSVWAQNALRLSFKSSYTLRAVFVQSKLNDKRRAIHLGNIHLKRWKCDPPVASTTPSSLVAVISNVSAAESIRRRDIFF